MSGFVKPLVFNYRQYEELRDAYKALLEENERLRKERTNLEIKCRILEERLNRDS